MDATWLINQKKQNALYNDGKTHSV